MAAGRVDIGSQACWESVRLAFVDGVTSALEVQIRQVAEAAAAALAQARGDSSILPGEVRAGRLGTGLLTGLELGRAIYVNSSPCLAASQWPTCRLLECTEKACRSSRLSMHACDGSAQSHHGTNKRRQQQRGQ